MHVTWRVAAALCLLSITGPASASPAGPETGRIIVKFRNGSATGSAQAQAAADKVTRLERRTGIPFRQSRRISGAMFVVEVDAPATPATMRANLEQLQADPEVEFAEPDERRFAQAIPNDTMFPGQWYLQNAATAPSAVDAVDAWDLTTGSAGVVVADLDTGILFDHPDLGAAASAGRMLPGYDFVSDRDSANDGNARDADPSDPGDWVTSADAATPAFSGCSVSDSSWHGTRTAGIIGALSNNARGVSGLFWNGWILPARVLGKCGGLDSDIQAAMLWSAGIAVDGVPTNPYPARVVNLSLGSASGSCPQSYRNVISQLAARSVLVVVSAGNEGGPVSTPANCPGVAAVAGIRHAGTKVGFSNLGPAIALSAPGGNCVNTGQGEPCLYSLDTTTNLGIRGPTVNGYTDQFNFNVGTSFSAPIVTGIAGLMLAVNSRLSPAQMIARLQEGAKRPFPTASSSVPVCHVPVSSTDLQTAECVCTTQTCGAGMANALGAVQAARRPVAAIAVPASVLPGQNVVLSAAGSGGACGRSIASYAWTVVASDGPPPGIVGANTATATAVAPAAGSFTLRLIVVDDAGRSDSADVVVSPTSATTAAPAAAGSPACPTPIVVTPPTSVTVTPAAVTLLAGSGSQTFVATVTGSSDTRVGWSVNGVPGGDATYGTITADGVYTAPATRPSPATFAVTAVSTANASVTGSATVTIARPPPIGGGGGGGGSADLAVLLALGLGALARGWRRD